MPSSTASPQLQGPLRLRLMSRSEHWKAEAQKRARLSAQADGPAQILTAAMERLGLNPPRLAREIQTMLKRRGLNNPKADRSTVYRILNGRTKRPNPAIRNALVEVLKLDVEDASTVQRGLGWNEFTLNSDRSELRKD